ncbi:MAG: NAD-binding protein, partial [Bacteroidota bacterium]
TLFQIGEFSLILSRTGIENGLMNDFDYQVFLAAAVVMMAFTPFVIRWGRSAAEASVRYRLPGFLSRELVSNEDYEHKFEDHIVIIGYGLVGRNIVRAAKIADIPYVIIEMNPDTVKSEKEAGEPIFFGDSTKEEVLIHAGVKKANTVVVAISDPTAERAITGLARSLNPHAYIIVRTRYVGETGPLTKLGADEVIPEEYETSIEIFALVLSKYLVPAAEIEQFISHVRREGYSMLRSVSQSRMTGGQLRLHAPDYEMRTYRVTKDSPLDGKRIADSNLRSDFDTMILLIKRDGESHPNPPADMHLREGDLVVMFGKSANLISCRDLFRCE